MPFLRRDRNDGPHPVLLPWRVGLFFLAAGVWLAGVLAGDERITGAAIVILVVAVMLRLFGRRRHGPADEEAEEPEARE